VILHLSPHADDETLGCGGTLLRHVAEGDDVHWAIVTAPSDPDWTTLHAAVAAAYGFAGTHELGFADARLDVVPLVDLVDAISRLVAQLQPAVLYLPHPGDPHSDHRVVFEAAVPSTKWFRYPSVRAVYAYETPSETDASLDPRTCFHATRYRDITAVLARKLEILTLYGAATIGVHPFPRSVEAVSALARWRGAEAGFQAAEAFTVLRERG
jgi:LmbE family N-acetylglucosaminyl deacetylase